MLKMVQGNQPCGKRHDRLMPLQTI